VGGFFWFYRSSDNEGTGWSVAENRSDTRADKLSVTAVPSETRIKISRVTSAGLNVREQPGSNAPLVFTLSRGTEVRVSNETRNAEGNNWVRIRICQHNGWVNSRYLEVSRVVAEPTPPRGSNNPMACVINVAPGRLRVRSEPSTDARIITELTEATEIEVLNVRNTQGEEWLYIRKGDVEGWVSADFVDLIE
jgi:N-acetylmuramoyl-L-alanine amidase